jgi:hypothetical protein
VRDANVHRGIFPQSGEFNFQNHAAVKVKYAAGSVVCLCAITGTIDRFSGAGGALIFSTNATIRGGSKARDRAWKWCRRVEGGRESTPDRS